MTMYIDDDGAASALKHRALLDALTAAHVAHHRGEITQPIPTVLPLPGSALGGVDDPRHVLMSASAADLTLVKVLLDAPGRRATGGPAQRSMISVYSTATGDCLALVEGRALTRTRTAMATVLAVRTLARADTRTVAVVGAGALAAEHVRALASAIGPERLVLWARRREAAEQLSRVARSVGCSAEVADTICDLAASADAVITVTPARLPLLSADHLRPGLHVSAVGSPPRPGYRELAESAFASADLVVVDDVSVARAESAQVQAALAAGMPDESLIELGAVLAGDHPGRTDPDQITVHSSIGVALQDLAAVRVLLGREGLTSGSAPGTDLG
ncbi:MAG TPA: ornithine cyclodeaminase [Micrococcales bacterium]|uniref:ornithine cyclodeaminase family protein n=1 Tax=Miniimonas arenae TaxID=676201 RepID=UPI000EC5D6A7|nr:hypothetical protein [Miniimonas arenae]HCX84776.1 ornithine cyclodeaminase [Micrococcales bacterium]